MEHRICQQRRVGDKPLCFPPPLGEGCDTAAENPQTIMSRPLRVAPWRRIMRSNGAGAGQSGAPSILKLRAR